MVLLAFILGRCNGYSGNDEERLKQHERARQDDSLRAVQRDKITQDSIRDYQEALRLVDSARKAEKKVDDEADIYLEQNRIYNQKIKDEITSKNPDVTDAMRVDRVRIYLARKRALEQRQQQGFDTAKGN